MASKSQEAPKGPPRWNAEDFRNPPDMTGWTKTRVKNYKKALKEFEANEKAKQTASPASASGQTVEDSANPGDSYAERATVGDETSEAGASQEFNIPIRPSTTSTNIEPPSEIIPESKEDAPEDIDEHVAEEDNTEDAPDEDNNEDAPEEDGCASDAGPSTATGNTVPSAAAAAAWYTIRGLSSDPPQEQATAPRNFDGDPTADVVRNYIATGHRRLTQANVPQGRGTFSANHLALSVGGARERVLVYPVTITREQRPQSLRSSPAPVPNPNAANGPTVPAKKVRRLFVLLLEALRLACPNHPNNRASNYKTKVATVHHELVLQINAQTVRAPFQLTIRYFDASQAGPSNDPWIYQLAVARPRTLEFGRLQRTLTHSTMLNEAPFTAQEIEDSKSEFLDTMNMLITQIPNEGSIVSTTNPQPGVAIAGASKFYPFQPNRLDRTHNLNNGLSALFGYYRSVRLLNGPNSRLQLNINNTTSAFYRWENLQRVMSDKLGADVNNRPAGTHDWQELERFVSGLQVRARYGNVDKVINVTGLAMTENEIYWNAQRSERSSRRRQWPWNQQTSPTVPNVTFQMAQRDAQGNKMRDVNGIARKQATLIQLGAYWLTTLGINTIGQQDFVVRTGNGEGVCYYPASVLTVMPGQHYKGQVAIPVGARPPSQNKHAIVTAGKEMFGYPVVAQGQLQPAANRFNLDVSGGANGGLLNVSGYRLGLRDLRYGANRSVNGRSRWNLAKTRCFQPPTLSANARWSFLEITQTGPGQNNDWNSGRIDGFCNAFDAARAIFGINLPSEVDSYRGYAGHKIPNNNGVANAVRQQMQQYPHVKLWVMLLPSKDTQLYSTIKIAGDLQVGVSSVCFAKKNTNANSLQQICANIWLKANLKLSRRSVNHTLATPSTLLSAGTMVVGIDVTHAPGGARKNSPSIAAVVASIDQNYAQWPASLKLNQRLETDKKEAMEEVQDLKRMMIERLACYRRYNNSYPTRIVIYRDGLSEGQFEMARTREFGRIMAAIEQVYTAGNHPEILLICAVKRHHTRFLPQDNPTGGNAVYQGDNNPAVSTVFYDTVTYGENQDFFLVSQNAMGGATVRPTHYVVLINTASTPRSISDVANMTLDLCFVFGRATVSVGLATPAYYADLACTRAAKYMAPHTRPDPNNRLAPFNYANAANIQLAPRDNPNNAEHFGDSMFYL